MAIQNDRPVRLGNATIRGGRKARGRRGLDARLEPLEDRLVLSGNPPTAVDDLYSVAVGGVLNVASPGVLANDTDPESDALTAILGISPTNGTLTLNADGSIQYTPNTGFHGTDTFTYKANDGTGDSALATVTIKVNTAPAAVAETYTVAQGATLTITAPGVLANDSDADGDPLTATVAQGPSNGTLTLNTDGSFTYTPNSAFSGTDSFIYKASDGTSDSAVTTVDLTVTPASTNHAPTSVADTYRTGVSTPLVISAGSGVLANDTDSDNDPLTATLVAGASHGTLTLNADGSFQYTPSTGFRGTDTFTYKANDGKADGSTTTVTLQVNNPPIGAADSYTTTNALPLNISVPGVLSNDTDTNGDSLTAVLVSPTSNGTLSVNANGSFLYNPNTGFVGTDQFIYQPFDGLNNGEAVTVSISVTSSNNTAPVANNNSYTTTQGTPIQVNKANGILANDTDTNKDALTAVLVTKPTFGTLTLSVDGSFVYTPRADFSGTDVFTYKASDGKTQSALATVLLFVDPPDTGEGSDTITGAGAAGNDDGTAGDGITSITRPSFSGVAPANFVVKLFATKTGGAAALVGQVTAGGDGKYTVTSSSLGEGTYAFSATATDPASTGGTPAATVALGSLTISTSAPPGDGRPGDSRDGRGGHHLLVRIERRERLDHPCREFLGDSRRPQGGHHQGRADRRERDYADAPPGGQGPAGHAADPGEVRQPQGRQRPRPRRRVYQGPPQRRRQPRRRLPGQADPHEEVPDDQAGEGQEVTSPR